MAVFECFVFISFVLVVVIACAYVFVECLVVVDVILFFVVVFFVNFLVPAVFACEFVCVLSLVLT